MLSPDEVREIVADLHRRHLDEMPEWDRIHGYVRGRLGVPALPEGANDELRGIAKDSVQNVLDLVRDAFVQALSVVGFRSPNADEDAAVWLEWQKERLDARQDEPLSAAVTYGAGYAFVGDRVSFRTPRQCIAVYADPRLDPWPKYALETWVDDSGKRPVRRGVLVDDEARYPVTLGKSWRRGRPDEDVERVGRFTAGKVEVDEDDFETHEFGVCPVVRFANPGNPEMIATGEIAHLIPQQRAINAVNFDRLTVSRYGAFPQKYAIGWAPSESELIKASVARLMAFHDDDVKVGAYPAATITPYNEILREMKGHVALTAQIPAFVTTGDMDNFAAAAAAMLDAPYQRKLSRKRAAFGESWEQVLWLMGQRAEIEIPDEAEVVWDDSESRSFAEVVDGIVKLASAGAPIETLLEDIPGWSQQRRDAAVKAIRRSAGRAVAAALGNTPDGPGNDDGSRDQPAPAALGAR